MIESPTSSGDGESPNIVSADDVPTVSIPADAPELDARPPTNEKVSMTEQFVSEPTESAASSEHIDQIRNILVGGLKRDTGIRFEEIERRVAMEMADLRSDIASRLDTLDVHVREETEALARRIAAEHSDRVAAMVDFAESVRLKGDALGKRIDASQESADTDRRALRQQVVDEAVRAQNALREQANALKREIDVHVEALTDSKTDRQGLAGMFSEIAARLAQGD